MESKLMLRLPMRSCCNSEKKESKKFTQSLTTFLRRKGMTMMYCNLNSQAAAAASASASAQFGSDLLKLVFSRYACRLALFSESCTIKDTLCCIRNYDAHLNCFIHRLNSTEIKDFLHCFAWRDNNSNNIIRACDLRIELQSVIYNRLAALLQLSHKLMYASDWDRESNNTILYLLEAITSILRVTELSKTINDSPLDSPFDSESVVNKPKQSPRLDTSELKLNQLHYTCSVFLQLIILYQIFGHIQTLEDIEELEDENGEFQLMCQGLLAEVIQVKKSIEYINQKIVKGEQSRFLCFIFSLCLSASAWSMSQKSPINKSGWLPVVAKAASFYAAYKNNNNNNASKEDCVPQQFENCGLCNALFEWLRSNSMRLKNESDILNLMSSCSGDITEALIISDTEEFQNKISRMKNEVWPCRSYMDWLSLRTLNQNCSRKRDKIINNNNNNNDVQSVFIDCHATVVQLIRKNLFLFTESESFDNVSESTVDQLIDTLRSKIQEIKTLMPNQILNISMKHGFLFKQCCTNLLSICELWITTTCYNVMERIREKSINKTLEPRISSLTLNEIMKAWNTATLLFIAEKKCLDKNTSYSNLIVGGGSGGGGDGDDGGGGSAPINECKDLLLKEIERKNNNTIYDAIEKKTEILKGVYCVCCCIKDKIDEIMKLLNEFTKRKI